MNACKLVSIKVSHLNGQKNESWKKNEQKRGVLPRGRKSLNLLWPAQNTDSIIKGEAARETFPSFDSLSQIPSLIRGHCRNLVRGLFTVIPLVALAKKQLRFICF